MKFLVDAQLPQVLAVELRQLGLDALVVPHAGSSASSTR